MAYLHEDPDAFEQLSIATSEHFGLIMEHVVKDYYAMLALKAIVTHAPDLVFKGGTCLSKCHRAINRFSEDIDLGSFEQRPSEAWRRKAKAAVVAAMGELGYTITNVDQTRSRRSFNRYLVDAPANAMLRAGKMLQTDGLIIETAFMTPARPWEEKSVQSYIGEYCTKVGLQEALERFDLASFEVNASSPVRTMCDKIYALCDYYLAEGPIPPRQSRHIYDLYMLSKTVDLDDGFGALFNVVRGEREGVARCLSAHENVSVPEVLRAIRVEGVYKDDYDKLTIPLLYDAVGYEEASKVLEMLERFLRTCPVA